MIPTDEELLEMYLAGFRDELDNTFMQGMFFNTPLERKAYEIGGAHALLGDDVRSVDYLTREELLRKIKYEKIS